MKTAITKSLAVSIASMLFVAIACLAQTGSDNQPLWKFGEQKLIAGTQKFLIQLEKSQTGIEGGIPSSSQSNKVKITLDVENMELEYNPPGGLATILYIKIDNADDLNKLKLLLENFVDNLTGGGTNTQLPSISFSSGNYNASCDFGFGFQREKSIQAGPGPYSGVITLKSTDREEGKFIRRYGGSNTGPITIADPTALLFTINSMSEILSRMEKANDDAVDADKKASKITQDKVQTYLATSSGIKLGVKIQTLFKKITALNSEEKKYLLDAKAEMNKILKTPGADPSYAVNQYTFLVTNHKDSDELKGMRDDLRKLLDEFQNDCGLSYDEAWTNGGKAIIERETK